MKKILPFIIFILSSSAVFGEGGIGYEANFLFGRNLKLGSNAISGWEKPKESSKGHMGIVFIKKGKIKVYGKLGIKNSRLEWDYYLDASTGTCKLNGRNGLAWEAGFEATLLRLPAGGKIIGMGGYGGHSDKYKYFKIDEAGQKEKFSGGDPRGNTKEWFISIRHSQVREWINCYAGIKWASAVIKWKYEGVNYSFKNGNQRGVFAGLGWQMARHWRLGIDSEILFPYSFGLKTGLSLSF